MLIILFQIYCSEEAVYLSQVVPGNSYQSIELNENQFSFVTHISPHTILGTTYNCHTVKE